MDTTDKKDMDINMSKEIHEQMGFELDSNKNIPIVGAAYSQHNSSEKGSQLERSSNTDNRAKRS